MHASDRVTPMPLRDLLLAVAIVVAWGFNFVVMKYAVSEVPPFLLTGARFALAAFPAIFLVRRPSVSWRYLVIYGTGFGIMQFGFMFTAFRLGMPAGLTSVLLQTQALMTVGLAYPFLGERASRAQIGAIAIVAAGVFLIAAGAARNAALLPVVLVLFGAFGWAMANITLKLARPADLLSFTVWSGITPAIAMLSLSAFAEGTAAWQQSWTHLTWLGVGAVLYLAYPISLASGWAWNSLLSRYSAATFAPFALLVPVVAMAGGALIYGERLTTLGLAGSALVLAGLAVLVVAGRVASKPTVV